MPNTTEQSELLNIANEMRDIIALHHASGDWHQAAFYALELARTYKLLALEEKMEQELK